MVRIGLLNFSKLGVEKIRESSLNLTSCIYPLETRNKELFFKYWLKTSRPNSFFLLFKQ